MNARSVSDDALILIGRILIASLYLPDGIGKLFDYSRFLGSIVGKMLPLGIHLPFAKLWAAGAVFAEIAGSLLILLGSATRWGVVLLAVFIVMTNLTTHRFWEMEGPLRRANELNFYKNVSLIGGLIFLYVAGAGRLSWDAWRSAGRKPANPREKMNSPT